MHAVQHHHAHLAACLGEHGRPLDAGPVLGLALDGIGQGEDGSVWGCELLELDYRGFRRLASLRPVPLPGGVAAIREPWRNLYAQLRARWPSLAPRHAGLSCIAALQERPLAALESMIAAGINAPASSSAGRLFDAVAVALGFAPARVEYSGEAAVRLEAAATRGLARAAVEEAEPWVFERVREGELVRLDPTPMWTQLLDALAAGRDPELLAARFVLGFARALAALAVEQARARGLDTVALSGGCFVNRILLETLSSTLEGQGLRCLTHAEVPANDGGLALGQGLVALAEVVSSSSRCSPSKPRASQFE